MAKVVTFGEIMLRLKSPAYERFFQSPVLEATFGQPGQLRHGRVLCDRAAEE